MKSFDFPNMIKTNSAAILQDKKATENNFKLLLMSEKGELFGDPYYGVSTKLFIYDQNSPKLKDIFIDDIYTQSVLFIPQLQISRNDIRIEQINNSLVAHIGGRNVLDFTPNLYEIVLFQEDKQ